MTNVQANCFERLWADCRDDYMEAVARVGASGWYILGNEVQAFEHALARYCGSPAAVGCANGMDALEIALRVHGIGSGDKVLTTPLSAFPTALGILRSGAVPVFCDTDEHGLIDPAAAADAFAEHPDIRGIMPVHLYGHLADVPELERVAEATGAILVEDAAQAIGATRRGDRPGSRGHIACFSFYPTKNLGVIGDGGALILSEAQAEMARSIRNYGQTERYVHDVVGLNSRLDELHAATLHDAFLPRLDSWLTRRRRIAARYLREIAPGHVELCPGPDPEGAGWHLFPVRVDPARRDSFLAHLRQAKVQPSLHYPVLIPEQRALTQHGSPIVVGSLDRARRFSSSEVSLPIHPFLSDDEVGHVIAAVNSWST